MQRRQLLALASVTTASIAGCLDMNLSGDGGSEQHAIGDTAESSDGTTVTVQDVTVRRLVPSTSVGSSTHIDVACLPNHQFAVVDVETDGPDGGSIGEDVRLALEVDGTTYPRPDQHWYWAVLEGDDRPGKPAFPAPVSDGSEVSIIWQRSDSSPARWEVPARTRERLSSAPSFSLTAFQAPGSIERGDAVEASFTVENRGDREGEFVAEFGAGPLSDHPETTVTVPADGEQTVSEQLTPHTSAETDEIEVTLDWGCDRRVHRVEVTD